MKNSPDMTELLGRILECWTDFLKGIEVRPGSTAEAEMYHMDEAIKDATALNAKLAAVRPEGVAIPCQKDGCQYGRLAVEKLLGPQEKSSEEPK